MAILIKMACAATGAMVMSRSVVLLQLESVLISVAPLTTGDIGAMHIEI